MMGRRWSDLEIGLFDGAPQPHTNSREDTTMTDRTNDDSTTPKDAYRAVAAAQKEQKPPPRFRRMRKRVFGMRLLRLNQPHRAGCDCGNCPTAPMPPHPARCACPLHA